MPITYYTEEEYNEVAEKTARLQDEINRLERSKLAFRYTVLQNLQTRMTGMTARQRQKHLEEQVNEAYQQARE